MKWWQVHIRQATDLNFFEISPKITTMITYKSIEINLNMNW